MTDEIDQDSIRDLLDEAKSMASIDEYHDNIVNLHGIMINGPEKVPKSMYQVHNCSETCQLTQRRSIQLSMSIFFKE